MLFGVKCRKAKIASTFNLEKCLCYTENGSKYKFPKEIIQNMKLGIDDEVTCFISQYFSINADIA